MISPLQKVRKIQTSKFTWFIRFLSRIYILPLHFNQDYSEADFSIFHYRTFISLFLNSIPFICSFVLWFFQDQLLKEYLDASSSVYIQFDFFFMRVFFSEQLTPFLFIFVIIACKVWVAVPELALDAELNFTRTKKALMGSVALSLLGATFVVIGNYLAIYQKLTEYSTTQNIINLIIAILLPWIWSCFMFTVSFAMLISIIQKMTEKIETGPSFDIESWVFQTIMLFKRLQEALNFPCMLFVTGR